MSTWAFACSSVNCTDPPRSPCEPSPVYASLQKAHDPDESTAEAIGDWITGSRRVTVSDLARLPKLTMIMP